MGNNITKPTTVPLNMLDIFDYDCETLDIGNRIGNTGYIDIIREEETYNNNIMKGIDKHFRKFIVMKASFIYSYECVDCTFSTVFQRYSDDNNTWVCCGHYGKILLFTEGGISEKQSEFLKELVYNKSVDLTLEKITELRLNCYPYPTYLDEVIDPNLCPIKVIIGH